MNRSGRRWAIVTGLVLAGGCSGIDGIQPVDDGQTGQTGQTAALSSDTQTVWLVLREQADLLPAREMTDWRARGQMVFERLTRTATLSQGPLRALLRSRGIDHQPFWIVNAIKITAPAAVVRLLGSLPEIATVVPDRTIALPPRLEAREEPKAVSAEWGLENIGATAVWERYGFHGDGVVVASIDTGVDFTHPALKRQYRGRKADGGLDHNYNWYDPASICGSPSLKPCDNAGHGTHTMGIILGEDQDDPTATRIGVAPRARWIAAKGCESGDCSLASLMRAGEWMVAPTDLYGANPRPDMRPHIVNNSWSAGAGDDVFFQKIVKAWVAAGIFPAFASGNDGPTCNSADSPADYSESYAVGAYDSENKIAAFSSRGSTALGGIKPNISAPGVNIRSSIPGGGYGVSNGTSMATPHVSGAVALIWSAAPRLLGDIAGTRALLDQTATDTEDLSCGGNADNNNVFGQGRLNALAAVTQAPRAPTGTLQGFVQAVSEGRVVVARDATVRAQGPADRSASVDGNGAFGLVLPEGRYQVTVSAFGYVSQTTDLVVTAEERAVQNFVLEPAPSHVVRGIIRQNDGRPLAGARVNIEGTPVLAAVTDQNGAYTLTGVPPGSYRVSASRGGCFGKISRSLAVAGDAQMDLALPRRTDYYGYYCEPLRAGFIDATQVLPLSGQRASITVPLPFNFSFYGRIYREAEVSSSGYLSFVPAGAVELSERRVGKNEVARIPDGQTPNAAVYAFWDDLIVDDRASVRTETIGTAPQRAFVVEWRDVAFRDRPDLRVRFEIVLHEDGRILTQYFTAGPEARQQGASATVGLEDPEGGDGLEVSDHDASLDSGSALLYALPPSGVLEGQVTDATDGQPVAGVQLLAWSDELGVRTTLTDGEGRYRLELRVGLHAVGASAPYYGEETRAVQMAQGQAVQMDLALKSGRAQVAPASLAIPSNQPPTATFTLENRGTRAIFFDLHATRGASDEEFEDLPWVRFEPQSGNLAPGAQQTFTVNVDRAALDPGSHHISVVVWTDTPVDTSLRLPLNLVVADHAAPPPTGRGGSGGLGELRAPSRGRHKQAWGTSPQPLIEATAAPTRAR
jgi:subtilisin family serine protease